MTSPIEIHRVPFETIFSSAPQFAAACAILVVAQCVYVLFGFGAGLIAVGGLAMFLPGLQDVVVMLLLLGLPGELYVVGRERRAIDWRGVAFLVVGVAAGVPVGAWILRIGNPTFVLTILGVFLLLAGATFLFVQRVRALAIPRWLSPPIGAVAGVLAGLFGTGGPPLILFYQLQGTPKAKFRGNLMSIFLSMTLVRIPVYAFGGLITSQRLWSCLAVMPAVLLGAWLGNRLHVKIEEAAFRRAVSVALFAIGLILVVRTLE